MSSTKSPIIKRHIRYRDEGLYEDPVQELYEINRLLDSDTFTPTERRWAYNRRTVLHKRLKCSRFKTLGIKPGRLTQTEKTEIKFRAILSKIHKLLDR